MKTRLFGMLAALLLSISATAQSEDYALVNFDHEVTQPAPGGSTTDGGSTNPDHILENISIFDFALTDTEMEAIRAIDRGDAGRSFRLGYGNNGFGNFQDYTYDHTFTPSAIESAKADTKSSAEQIFTLDGRQVGTLQKGINIINGKKVMTK